MKYNELGGTGIKVSELCLGSMTWGTQNTTAEGHAQIDMALEHGVNFIDTAEMYPVNPLTKDTQGDTERVIGEWVAKSGKRDTVVIATKVSGSGYKNVRDGAPISRKTILTAVENSLRSLQTDYIDLYQLHWPNRGSYMFRQNWHYDPSSQNKSQTIDHMNEVLNVLNELVQTGKIRAVGLSNESAWGTTQWVQQADLNGLPRMATIQNEYSLLCRLFDTDLAETCHNENVGLLAYSPLATGLLTGKYQNGAVPEGSRKSLVNNLGGRTSDRVWEAVDAYLAVANKHGIDPTQMALAWCLTRPFMASVIFGATSLDQLENSLKSSQLTLSDDVLNDIAAAHKSHPMPY
ncbi:aldo/keto reductase [Amylibacter kogurei]|uniref:Aldo/keto reductase n=1 Tax=Paramylibacter kogurei TaxID=1889778 RepID=A0A2G5K6N3_9RHOB|nr:aldo/keto reductase [Amylibacter kogurei]PIB25095.1 aldo/keto reductase [Amylibacter kogurei]